MDCFRIEKISNNLVPFPALFLIYFFYFLQYSILQDSSSLNFLRWGGSSCAEQIICAGLPKKGGVPGGGIESGTAVQQSSALPTKPRFTLTKPRCTLKATLHPNKLRCTLKPRCTLGYLIPYLKVCWCADCTLTFSLMIFKERMQRLLYFCSPAAVPTVWKVQLKYNTSWI